MHVVSHLELEGNEGNKWNRAAQQEPSGKRVIYSAARFHSLPLLPLTFRWAGSKNVDAAFSHFHCQMAAEMMSPLIQVTYFIFS